MTSIVDYINENFPSDWLSNLFFDENENEAGVDIKHPNNKEQYLTVLALEKSVGIGVLLEENRPILLDLSGFDYVFSLDQMDDLKQFVDHYRENGTPPPK